jgi:hypothetical protein
VQIAVSKMVKLYGQNLGIPGDYRLQDNRQGHSTTGWIKSMKNSNDSIGCRTFYLPACNASLHPTAPPRVPITIINLSVTESKVLMNSTFPLQITDSLSLLQTV